MERYTLILNINREATSFNNQLKHKIKPAIILDETIHLKTNVENRSLRKKKKEEKEKEKKRITTGNQLLLLFPFSFQIPYQDYAKIYTFRHHKIHINYSNNFSR